MAPVPAGFTEITYRFSQIGASGLVANVVAVDNTSVIPTTGPEDVADAFATNLLPELASTISLLGVTLRAGQGSGDPIVYEYDYDTPPVGGDGSISAPPNVAYLVRKNTNLGGRRNRGRMFLGGVTAGDLASDATIAPAKFTSISLNMQAWIDAVEALSWVGTFVLLHADGSTPTPITGWALQSKVATQRTRLRD